MQLRLTYNSRAAKEWIGAIGNKLANVAKDDTAGADSVEIKDPDKKVEEIVAT